MKNILVSIDFDDNEHFLIKRAFEFGKAFGAKVWIIHVAAPEPDFIGYDVGPQYIRDFRAEDLREEHRKIQAFADKLERNGLEAEGLLIQGATTEMIVEEAEKLKTDMIIVGHQERNFLYETFIGSVSKEVVDKSNIPVLVVPLS